MSCKERINRNLRKRIKQFKEINQSEDPIEKINEVALALTETKVYKLELSWGGPSDHFVFEYDEKNKEIIKIEYHFLNWFDGATVSLSPDSEEWEIAEELFYNCIFIE